MGRISDLLAAIATKTPSTGHPWRGRSPAPPPVYCEELDAWVPRGSPDPFTPGPATMGGIAVRLSKTAVQRIKPKADRDGLTVSSWVRQVVDQALEEREP